MFLVATIIIVPSIVAMVAQLVCYQQYLEAKGSFSAEYVPA